MTVWGLNLFHAGKDIAKESSKYDLNGFAAQLAYRFFLALFPFFIFLAALGGFVANAFNVQDPTGEVMDLIGDALPDEAGTLLENELENVLTSQNPGLLSIGVVGFIWAAAGGLGALMKGFNRIYEVEETRHFVLRYAIQVGLTVLGAGFILSAFLLLIIGQQYGTQILGEVGLEGLAATLVNLARWPFIIAMVMVAAAVVYWKGPCVFLPIQWISPGAVVFTAAWLIMTAGLGFYVGNFGDYSATYGALGGVVIILLWLYLTGLLLLVGAEINAYLARQKIPEQMDEAGAYVPNNERRTTSEPDDGNGTRYEDRDGMRPAGSPREGDRQPARAGANGGREQRHSNGARSGTSGGSHRRESDIEPSGRGRRSVRADQLALVGLISSVTLWRASKRLLGGRNGGPARHDDKQSRRSNRAEGGKGG